MKHRNYLIHANFEKNLLVYPSPLVLVKEDYNSVEFDFEFDIETGTKVLEIKKPDGKVWIKEIVDNKVVLVDKNTNDEMIPVINQSGLYQFEVSLYIENSKLTISKVGKFEARDEVVTSDDEQVKSDSRLPILDDLINKVETQQNELSTAIEESTTATNEAVKTTEEMENLKTEVENKVTNGSFNGATFIPTVDEDGNISWANDKNLANPDTINIKGPQGPQGIQGEAFKIKKTYSNKQAMINDFSNMDIGDYVMITSNIEVEDNAKLYCRGEEEWIYITDFSGATGIQGPQGPQGIQGIQGIQGPKPLKGVDYFTEAEKSEMVQEIIMDSNNAFNENVEVKTNEYNENHEAKIQEYNENTNSIINVIDHLIPKSEVSGNMVQISDSLDYKVIETKISGNYEQKKYEGQQLYDVRDVNTYSEIISVDDDDWITCAWDNTNGTTSKSLHYTTNNLRLKPDTNYLIVVEVKNVSGTGEAYFVSKLWVDPPREGQFINGFSKKFAELSSGGIYCKTIKTEADFSTIMSGLRTYIGYSAGESGSITFRISVIEDTSITTDLFKYEPFVGGDISPNPNYPQEVEFVKDYNVFKYKEKITITATSDDYTKYLTGYEMKLKSGQSYVLTLETDGVWGNEAGTDTVEAYLQNVSLGTNLRITKPKYFKFTPSGDYEYRLRLDVNKNGTTHSFWNIMVYEDNGIKDYVPSGSIGIKVTGKNKFDTKDFINDLKNTFSIEEVTYNGKNCYQISIDKNTHYYTLKDLEKNQQYTIQLTLANNLLDFYIMFVYEDGSKSAIVEQKLINNLTKYTVTSDVNKTVQQIQVSLYSTATLYVEKESIQIVKGVYTKDTMPIYETYKEQIVSLDLQDNFVGKLPNGVIDEVVIDNHGNVNLIKNIKEKIIEESDLGIINSYWFTQVNYLELRKPEDSIGYNNFQKNYTLMNRFHKISQFVDQTIVTQEYAFIEEQGLRIIAITFPKGITLEEAKETVIGTKMYYQLATPEIIFLGKLDELIKTNEKYNDIYPLTSLETEISVKYALDIKKYIDNQNAIQDTKVSEIETLIATPSTASMLLENYASDLESEV